MDKQEKYELSDEDFERFRKLINNTSGIFFDRAKKNVLSYGLLDRAQAAGAKSLDEYYEFLTKFDSREEELQRLIAHLSVQETQFFRNTPQFDALKKYVLPEMIRRKSKEYPSLRVWSAGCSTGQEPYSVAMCTLDIVPNINEWNIKILGTDLSDDALDAARKGWYSEKKLSQVDEEYRKKYFRSYKNGFIVNQKVKSLVEFERHNLITDGLPIAKFGTCDVVFCRNVIIYFTHETARFVIEHFFDILNPGGYLFLGHSETLWRMSAKYSLVEVGDAFIYRKPLPRSLEGRRFIADRRMRDSGPPEDTGGERRVSEDDRRNHEYEGLQANPMLSRINISEHETEEPVLKCLIREGRNNLESGDFSQAQTFFEEALKLDAGNAQVYFLLGLSMEKGNQPAAAAESYRRAVFCDPDMSLAAYHLASVLEQTGKIKSALREYRNAARGFREHPPGIWESELEVFDVDCLVELCESKIKSLK